LLWPLERLITRRPRLAMSQRVQRTDHKSNNPLAQVYREGEERLRQAEDRSNHILNERDDGLKHCEHGLEQ
jgi:hypothetical protein